MRVTKCTSVFCTKRMLQQKLQPTKSVFGSSYEDKEHWMLSMETVTREYKLLPNNSTSNSVRKVSRNVYSFRSSCSCDSYYSAKPANKLEVIMTTNQENLDIEKLTETAATRRGCVTPTTLPSAVQPASARYCKQILRIRNELVMLWLQQGVSSPHCVLLPGSDTNWCMILGKSVT